MTDSTTPALLLIVREPLLPASRAEYAPIEDDIARACAELGCPHPHLALEPVDGAGEVWWLNAFASQADKERVERAYAENRPLMDALERLGQRKAALIGSPVQTITRLRPDLSRGPAWTPRAARFVIVAITRDDAAVEGAVYEAPGGDRYILRAAATREQAEAIATASTSGARVLSVIPRWGMPAQDWVDADPEFWQPNPSAGPGSQGNRDV